MSVADHEEVRLLGTELVGTCRAASREASGQSKNTDTEGKCWWP